ncbi:MAG: PAS domain S-box protein, partial [Candidatus Hodarchaeota archaeon]
MNGPEKARILLVDDESDLLDITKMFLAEREPNLEIEVASSSSEALEKLSGEYFDVIVADYQMPGIDGLDLLRHLRENANNIPFIMFTGRGREEVAMQALNLGASYYLMKGGDPDSEYGELAHIIRSVIHQRRTEEALRKSEQRYRELVEKLHEGVLVEDAEEKITFVNPQTLRMLGYSADELIGQSTAIIIPESEKEKIRQETEKRHLGISSAYEAALMAKNEYSVPVIISAAPLFSDSGTFQGVLTVFIDITERKQIEHELRERLKELNCLYEISKIVERPAISLSEILQEVAQLLPSAWQYPDIAGACITLEEQSFSTENFKLSPRIQKADLRIRGQKMGEIAVSYAVKPPGSFSAENLFLREEQLLINSIAERLGRVIELKQADQALRQSEETYRTLISTSPDAVTVTDLEGHITFASQRTAQLHGFLNSEELLGKNAFDLIAPEDHEIAMKNLNKTLEAGSVRNAEYTLLRKNGSRFVGALNAALIKNGSGEPEAFIATTRDISDLKKAEKALQASEETFRRTFEAIPDPAYLWERQMDNRITLSKANQAAFQISKGGVGSFMGIELNELYQDRPEIILTVMHVLNTGETRQEEMLYKFQTTAEQRWLLVDYARPSDGKVLVIAKDITERKRDEEKFTRQRMELSEFAHAMAHDLRNRLNNIQGYASLIQKRNDPSYAAKIKDLVFNINELLSHSLTLAEAGLIAEKSSQLDLTEVICSVAEEVIPENITFEYDFLPLVTGDREKLSQIFQNLFENAVTHGNPTKIEVRRSDSEEGISIMIANDGKLIPKELHSKIFERGFSTKEGGSGMGLAIITRVVEAHGWHIALES